MHISTAIHLVQKLHFQRVGCVGRLFPTKTVQQNVEGNVAGGVEGLADFGNRFQKASGLKGRGGRVKRPNCILADPL